MTTATATVNAILARWIDPSVADSQALSCQSCAKALKCCDFQPFVSNFLLGAALELGVELPVGDFVYRPLGLVPSRRYRARHAATPAEKRDPSFLCGFYSEGLCRIWSVRPGECSTFLCEPAQSPPARQLLSERAFAVETRLAQKALLEMDFSYKSVCEEIDFLNDPAPKLESHPEALSIYRRAWHWAKELSAQQVEGFIGVSL